LKDIESVLQQEEDAKEMKPPTPKKEFAILISDPTGRLKGIELTGWVVQMEEGEDAILAIDKITTAAYEHNASPKGRKLPVETIGEACESVSPKMFKEQNVWVKTKLPVMVLRTDNKLAKSPGCPMD